MLRLSYEQLMRDSRQAFVQMLEFLGVEVDEVAVSFGMAMSSRKKVKEMEKERGEAIVKAPGIKFRGSFIRSGVVGEWKDYFTDKDIGEVESQLSVHGLSLGEFDVG